MEQLTQKKSLGLLLVLAVVVTYGPVIFSEFSTWDDDTTITENPHFNPPSLKGILYYWGHSAGKLYVPVTYSVWGTLAMAGQTEVGDEQGCRLNPWVFHIANVGVHVGSVLLAFAILKRLTGNEWAAGVGALVFGLHPVQVESVGWISGLKDVLCGMFTLAALLEYVRFRQEQESGRARVHYALATAALVLGMLCKPVAVVGTLMAGVLDYWLLRRRVGEIWRVLWPWVVLSVICLVSARVIQPASNVPSSPLWARPLIAADSLAFYLCKVVYPARLTIDYGRGPEEVMREGWVYWTWMVPCVVGVLLWRMRKRAPVLVAAGMVFVAGFLPLLGWTKFSFQWYSTVANRYMYLPMFGVGLAVAWVVGKYPLRARWVICGVVLSVLGVRSFVQAFVWRDTVSLFEHAIEVNPRTYAARNGLGSFLNNQAARIGVEQAGRTEQARRDEIRAMELYREAFGIKSEYLTPRINLAGLLVRRGQYAEAEEQLRQAQRLSEVMKEKPAGYEKIAWWLGMIADARGEYGTAADYFQEYVRRNPGDAVGARNLRVAQKKLAEKKSSGG